MRWILCCALFSVGCATGLVQSGKTYAIAWPGTQVDIVQIYDVKDGWAQCRSITDAAIWWCNLTTTAYLAEVTPRDAPPAADPSSLRAGK